MKILVLNAGSSSQKTRLYEIGDSLPETAPDPLWEADADWSQGQGDTELRVTGAHGSSLTEHLSTDDRAEVIAHILKTLSSGETRVLNRLDEIALVGHRVVHGGIEFEQSTVITQQVKETIGRLAEIAPAHNPAALQGIEAIERELPHTKQVAVFDTAFHSHMPREAAVYPLPYSWFEQGIRRFGFHGISYQYCCQRVPQLLRQDLHSLRLIACHLGNGSSLAAIDRGRGIETTMGFTPLEGLMMGSRSGSVDPGILLYHLRQQGNTVAELDATLNKSSGLKGIAGVSDMRQVQSRMHEGDAHAQLAFDMYVHRLRYFMGAMLASLGGVDAFVFTGGIGEHSPAVRAAACQAFAFLGLKLDPEKNAQSIPDTNIAATDSRVPVLLIHTQEDWIVAQECWKLR